MTALSIVVPVYHNHSTLVELHNRLVATCATTIRINIEVIFVNDGSTDDSGSVLANIASAHPHVRVITLSRNFGSQAAVMAGIAQTTGSHVAVIAADLQEPPEIIADLWLACQNGPDIALATRQTRDDPLPTRMFANLFYRLLRRFAIQAMPTGGFDCFVASRRVCDLLLDQARPNLYIPGELLWLGFERAIIPYERLARPSGTSMWTFWKKVRFFVDSFVSFSYAPIRLTTTIGLVIALLGFAYASVILALRLTRGFPIEGWASLAVIVLILGGVQLVVIGTLGEYLWRSLDFARGRPLYVVASVTNLVTPNDKST
jgi:glycosyltransferase involved in cell wall biosynthesis